MPPADDTITGPGGPYPRTNWRPRAPGAQAFNGGLDPDPKYRLLASGAKKVSRNAVRRALAKQTAAVVGALVAEIAALKAQVAGRGRR